MSSLEKRLNTSSCFSWGIPQPVSVTYIRISSLDLSTLYPKVIWPFSVNLLALLSKCSITWVRYWALLGIIILSSVISSLYSMPSFFLSCSISCTQMFFKSVGWQGSFSSETSRLATSSILLIRLVSNTVFFWISGGNSLRISASISSFMIRSENPTIALSGVRISWQIELINDCFIFSLSCALRCKAFNSIFILFSFFQEKYK